MQSRFAFAPGLYLIASFLLLPVSAQADGSDVLFVIGQPAELGAGRRVEAAVVVGGDLQVAGVLEGPAVAIGGNLNVADSARVDGPVAAIGGILRVAPGAQVVGPRVQVAGGDFSQVAADLAEKADGQYTAPPFWAGPLMRMFQIIALFVLGVLLLLLAPRPLEVVARTLRDRPTQVSLAGVLLLLGFGPLCALLAISVVGIPLIPLAVLVLIAMFVMGLTAACIDVGAQLPFVKGDRNRIGALAAGSLLLLVAVMLPFVGALLLFCSSFYAAGGVVISRFGTHAPPPRTNAITSQVDTAARQPG